MALKTAVDARYQVKDGTVTESKLANNSVTQDKIADGAVTQGKIATGAVSTQKIKDGAVTTSKIANQAVTGDKIAYDTITEDHLQDQAVTGAKLANGAVTHLKLGSQAVYDNNVASGANIAQAKIADSGLFGGNNTLYDDIVDLKNLAQSNGSIVENEIYELTSDTTVITLANQAVSGSTRVYVNGLRQMLGADSTHGDYHETVDGGKTKINFHYTVKAGYVVVVDYRK